MADHGKVNVVIQPECARPSWLGCNADQAEGGGSFAAIAGIAFAVILALVQLGFQDCPLHQHHTLLYSHLNADLVLISPAVPDVSRVGKASPSGASIKRWRSKGWIRSPQFIWIRRSGPTLSTTHERFIFVVGFKPRPWSI